MGLERDWGLWGLGFRVWGLGLGLGFGGLGFRVSRFPQTLDLWVSIPNFLVRDVI